MNVRNVLIALILLGGCIFLAIFSEGVLLPLVLPVGAYAVHLLGVKLE